MTVQIRGIEEIRAALRRLPEALSRKMLIKAARKALGEVRDETKLTAPVDTGALRQSIVSYAYKRKGSNDVGGNVGIRKQKSTPEGSTPGRKNPRKYAHIVERDTGFMRRAFETSKEAAVSAFADESRGLLNDAVRDAAG